MFVRWSFRGQPGGFFLGLRRHVSSHWSHIHRDKDIFHDLNLLPENAPLKMVRYLGKLQPEELVPLLQSDPRLTHFNGLWAPVLTAPDFDAAVQAFQNVEANVSEAATSTAITNTQPWQPRTYMLIHIIWNRAKTREQLVAALLLVQANLEAVHPSSRSALIIMTVARLTKARIAAPLRLLVASFRSTPRPTEECYNLLLRALTLGPGTDETSALVIVLVNDMEEQGYKLHQATYVAMSRPPFITLATAGVLEQAIRHDGLEPTVEQLEEFLNLMIRHGRRLHASWILDSLHSRTAQPRAREYSGNATTKWDSAFLGSFRKSSTAYHHLKTREAVKSESSADSRKRNLQSPAVPDDPHDTASTDWLSILRVAARDPRFDSQSLSSLFDQGGAQYSSNQTAYELAIQGLLHKQSVSRAVALWHQLRSSELPLNRPLLSLGVRALTLANEAQSALSLLEDAHTTRQKPPIIQYSKFKPRQPDDFITIHTLNQFMAGLRRIGRPDAVFAVWDSLGTLYGLSPDVYTLNIMLGTARWARKYDESFRGAFRSALAGLGLRGSSGVPRHVEGTSTDTHRAQVVTHLSNVLHPNYASVAGQWGSQPASRVALRIALQVFLGNWSHLRHIRSPAHAIRKAASDPALSPLSDAFNSISGGLSGNESLYSILLEDVPAEKSPSYQYPGIYPTDMTFRAFLDLLASESLHSEVPLVLAWMRALKVRPSKTTLATALVHWMEVSMDAPLIEQFKGGPGRSPYSVLMMWMQSWVGEANMPTRAEMSQEMSRLAFFRHSHYDSRQRFVVTDLSGNVARHRFYRHSKSRPER